MTKEELSLITETTSGYPVKDLRWLPIDNIIVGLVKDPILGKANLHDGYISGAWRKNGSPTNRIKGCEDLTLKIK